MAGLVPAIHVFIAPRGRKDVDARDKRRHDGAIRTLEMALARSRRSIDYWPGFVDALSTLVLGIIFLLTVFVVVQFFLSQEMAGKDTALSRLNAQIAQLTDLLSLEKTGKIDLEEQVARLNASLAAAESERERLRGAAEGAGQGAASARQQLSQATSALDAEKTLSARALAQVDLLNQQIAALRRQLGALEEALQASETKDKDQQTQIAKLGERLNIALAQRVQELTRYRSDFFGRLREILGNRADIRIVGDRFVFQSEVLFDSGQAVLNPEGRTELDQLASALLELERQIPPEIAWVLRVDGHTDVRPIASVQFPSNWALSAARAISVVQYLISKGVSPQHLVAAGFGEFQPLDPAPTEEAYRRNRRIELKLTER
jgi:chemotaxis protein MotB